MTTDPSSRHIRPELYEEFVSVRSAALTTFTTPGHKRRSALADDFLRYDVPLATGVEDRKFTRRLLETAEAKAARLWGGDHCRFGVSGSTQGNQALMLAVTKPGENVAVTRALHKSLLAGLVLSGANPNWLYPDVDEQTGLPLQISSDDVAAAAEAHPTAVFLVDPTYFGVVADLEAVRTAAGKSTPIVVDQAWGSHLGFHQAVPKGGLCRGADAVVISLHKTAASFTQASMTVIDKSAIDIVAFDHAFDLLATTSPSAAILASIDRTRALLEAEGERLLGDVCALAGELRERVNAIPGVTTLDRLLEPDAILDPTKVVIFTNDAGVRGYDLEDDLWERDIRLEMSERDFIVPLLTIADTGREIDLLVKELERAIDCRRSRPTRIASHQSGWFTRTEAAMTPREAFFSEHDTVDIAAANGRIAWETVVPYPPGIPAIVPGEVITRAVLDGLQGAHAAGARLAYCTDPSLGAIRVVRR